MAPGLGGVRYGDIKPGFPCLRLLPWCWGALVMVACHLHLSPASFSAILYLNGDFEGGAFYFTQLDAKTETVSSSAPRIQIQQIQLLPVGPVPWAHPLSHCKRLIWVEGNQLTPEWALLVSHP